MHSNALGQRRLLKVERPIFANSTGAFVRFDAGWCAPRSWMSRRRGVRRFCVDMGGFAFDASLLRRVAGEVWSYDGHGGESELIAKLLPGAGPEALQPLANCGRDVLVFHNEYTASCRSRCASRPCAAARRRRLPAAPLLSRIDRGLYTYKLSYIEARGVCSMDCTTQEHTSFSYVLYAGFVVRVRVSELAK